MRRTESGFTLVELMLVLVLAAVVLGMISFMIIRSSTATNDTAVGRSAQRQALDALDTMRRDLSVARSPAVTEWTGRREHLRAILYSNLSAVPGLPTMSSQLMCGTAPAVAYNECMRDIVYADGQQLWFRADAMSGAAWAGYECVGYDVIPGATAAERQLVRYISADWKGCGPALAATAERQTLVRSDATLTTTPFSYTMRFRPGWVGGGANPSLCTTSQLPTPAPGVIVNQALNFISAIKVELDAVVVDKGRHAAAGGLRTTVALQGRTSGDHAYAVGCGF
jgi:prepilin-type N-terminal cleavage/methylation domain-containing protein